MEREINLLSDDELNAVVGGRTNLANLGNFAALW
jgi:bacteriocin-like protein